MQISERDQAYAYVRQVRRFFQDARFDDEVVARGLLLETMIRQAVAELGISDWGDTLMQAIFSAEGAQERSEQIQVSNESESHRLPLASFDVGRNPGLIGWCYQAWNQVSRDRHSWAISRRGLNSHESAKVSALTQLFTDEYLADFLVHRCLGLLDEKCAESNSRVTICDPACGAGHILLSAVRYISRDQKCPRWLPEVLFGVDIDATAVALARALIFLQAMVCGYEDAPAILWRSLQKSIMVAPEPFGSLDRRVIRPELSGGFSVVITNPPYLGRRKLSAVVKDFLDREYPAGKVDLCAAFIQRCIELCAPSGSVGLLTTDKWIRLQGYQSLRNGLGDFKGILGELSLDLVCELGSRAFHPTSELHDGVKAALVCARKHTPSDQHRFELRNISKTLSYQEKMRCLQTGGVGVANQAMSAEVLQRDWLNQGTKSALLAVSDLPSDLISSEQRTATLADVVVGVQTSDDQSYVRYSWQVQPGQQGWRVHAKGGGYARWFGLNRWVINWERGAQEFFKTNDARARAESWADKIGWCYSWFANGALGLRVKDRGWSFGRAAASALFCDDVRVVAFLNSRFASAASWSIGGKIQLPEGIVRNIPVPRNLEAIACELVEAAVEIKRELIAGDILDVSFNPDRERRVLEDLALEALLLVVEGALESQVERTLAMSSSEVERCRSAYGQPVGGLALSKAFESHPSWAYVPERFEWIREALERYEQDLPIARAREQARIMSLSSPAVGGEHYSAYALPSTGVIESMARNNRVNPLDVVMACERAIAEGGKEGLELCAPRLKVSVASDILRTLGHRWWAQGGDTLVSRREILAEHELCSIVEHHAAALGCYGLIHQSPRIWLQKSFIPWLSRVFSGVPPLQFQGNNKGADAGSLACTHSYL